MVHRQNQMFTIFPPFKKWIPKPHGISNPTNAILPLSTVASLMGKGYNEEIIASPSYSRTLFTKSSPGRLGVARRAEASSISIPCGKKCEAGIVSFTS